VNRSSFRRATTSRAVLNHAGDDGMTSEHGRSGEQRAPRPFPAREAADEGGTQLPSARASAENRLPAARTGDDTAPPVFAGERADPRRHLDRLRSLQRAATRPGGVRGVLRWVAAHVGGSSALLDASGRSLGAWPERRTDALAAVAGHVERVGAGEAHSAVVDHDAHQATAVLPTGRARPTPVLVVTAAKEALLPEKDLLAEAARTLGLCWRAEQAERAEQRLERADTQIR
jgi:hypothetical protein